jgi:chemotaxis protein MotB
LAAAAGPLKDIQEELEKALAPEIRSRVVELETRKEGLVVSLREIVFCESGASTMRASAVGSVDRLAAVLASRSENMRIEGHTDNVPIHNAHFPSNWELSTSGACELVKLFIYRYRFTPSRLSAAEFHPVAESTSTDGRARNRRVDIVILNPTSSELIPPPLSSPQATLLPQFLRQNRLLHPNNRPTLKRLTSPYKGFP